MITNNTTSPTDQTAVGNHFAGLAREVDRADVGREPAANEADDAGPREEAATRRPPGQRRRLSAEELKAGETAAANARLREQVGRRIAQARHARNWSQTEAARMFGFATSAPLSKIENGMRMPPHDQLLNIARVLECSMDFFYGITEDEDIDRVGAARTRIAASVRRTIERTAEIVSEQIERHAKLIGPTVTDVRGLLAAGDDLLDATQNLIRLNSDVFDGMRGGATLIRTGCAFEAAAVDARRALRLTDALDKDLVRSLNALRVAGRAGDEDVK